MGNTSSASSPPSSAKSEFQELITSNPVMIFSTTTCPYCQVAKRTFKEMGTTFNAIELNKVDNGREIATELYQVSQQKTVMRKKIYCLIDYKILFKVLGKDVLI